MVKSLFGADMSTQFPFKAHHTLDQVKKKSWFGVLNILTVLVKDWCILREASNAILAESHGQVTLSTLLVCSCSQKN